MANSFPTHYDARLAAFRYGLTLWLLLTCAFTAAAQVSRTADGVTPRGLAAGAPAGSYGLSELESVNLYNGHLSFNVPVLRMGGRGTAGLTVVVRTSRSPWTVKRECFNSGGNIHSEFIPDDSWWSRVYIQPVNPGGLFFGRPAGVGPGPRPCPSNPNDATLYYAETRTTFTFIAPDGTEYEFYDVPNHGNSGTVSCETGNSGQNRGRVFSTRDGSGATFILDYDISDQTTVQDQSGNEFPPVFPADGYLLLKDGTRYRIGGGQIQWIRDRNGNTTTFYYESATGTGARVSRIVDSLGREAYFDYDGPLPWGRCWRIRYKGTGGAERAVTIAYSNLSGALSGGTTQTLNQLFPGTDSGSMYNPAGMVQSVTMPDNRGYQFWYNAYAELARVRLPTGGKVEYAHEGGELNGAASGLVGQYDQSRHPRIGYCGPIIAIYRRLVQRSVFRDYSDDATPEGTTTYSKATLTPNTTGNGNLKDSTITVSQFEGGASGTERARSLHTFYGDPIVGMVGNYPLSDPSWEEGREYQTEDVAPQNSNVLRRVVHTWANAEMPGGPRVTATTVTLEPQGANKVSKQTFGFDQYNNQTDVYEYDFGAGAPGALKRHTHTAYLTTNPANGIDYTSASGAHLRGLPRAAQVYEVNPQTGAETLAAQTETLYDEAAYPLLAYGTVTGWAAPNTPARGLATTSRRWLDTGNTWLETHAQYDQLGNLRNAWDARGAQSQISYADSFSDGAARNTYAFPTGTTSAIPDPTGQHGSASALTTSSVYDFSTGLVTSTTDANGVTTNFAYDDPLDRPTQAVYAAGTAAQAQTTVAYDDTNRTVTTTSDLNDYNDNLLKSETIYDGLGRTTESRAYESATAFIRTKREYDALGRLGSVTNPYRTTGDPTYGATTTVYDALGRVQTVATSDGASVRTDYDGTKVMVTDQAGKKRVSDANALGQLTDVWEITPADSSTVAVSFGGQNLTGYLTHYDYDKLGNLQRVTQGAQTRGFVYDSLSRLTSAANPESGTVEYRYDANGNLILKIDPRPRPGGLTLSACPIPYTGGQTATCTEYDSLNRVRTRSYNDGTPNVTYAYDTAANGKGRPASVGSSVSAYAYAGYDALGRVTGSSQTTGGVTFTMPDYRYNLAGGLLSEQYPSGRVVKTEYDGAGRVAGVKGEAAGSYYAGGAASDATNRIRYAASGAASALRLGNGLWEHAIYNSRFQPTRIGLGTSSTSSGLLQLDYSYGTTDNNGNVLTQTVTAPGAASPFVQSYGYDELNRVKSAEETTNSTSTWKQVYTYDRYGNRALAAGTTYPAQLDATNNPSISPANNRLTSAGYSHDAAGNLLCDPARQCVQGPSSLTPYYSYDAESRMRWAGGGYDSGGTTYSYDGEGRRVRKATAGGEVTVFVYDAAGRVVAEYSNRVERNGTQYLTQDSLGSMRVVTDEGGAVRSRHDYLPFGEEVGAGVGGRTTAQGYSGSDTNPFKFAQLRRDGETGLDYAQNRYYSNALGRFTSVDPENAGVREDDPQTWNGYAYAHNNPVVNIDPDGLSYLVCDNSGKCQNHWDEQWKQLFDSKNASSVGVVLKGDRDSGSIFNADGEKIGTYRFTGQDYWSDFQNRVVQLLHDPGTWGKAAPRAIANVAIGVVVSRAMKRMNLPSAKKVAVDMEEVRTGHMEGGLRVDPASKRGKDLFPYYMKEAEIESAIRDAYTHSEVVRTQGTRLLMRGITKDGTVIEMWFNRSTRIIETAYPKGKVSQ